MPLLLHSFLISPGFCLLLQLLASGAFLCEQRLLLEAAPFPAGKLAVLLDSDWEHATELGPEAQRQCLEAALAGSRPVPLEGEEQYLEGEDEGCDEEMETDRRQDEADEPMWQLHSLQWWTDGALRRV